MGGTYRTQRYVSSRLPTRSGAVDTTGELRGGLRKGAYFF